MTGATASASRVFRAAGRIALVLLVLNAAFLLLVVCAPGDTGVVRERVRAAFDSGDLGFDDYLLFDSRRGFFQYNDCNVLQMIANANPSRLARAISPIVYSANDDWTDQCAVLHRVGSDQPDLTGLTTNRYSRYWHGYTAGVAMALRAMDVGAIRRILVAAVWMSLAGFTVVMMRSGAASRLVALAIGSAAALFWGVPYFDPGFTFGFGDTAMLAGLAVFAARPHRVSSVESVAIYAAGFGAVVVFFEMLTGQLPVAAAWLIASIVALRRDHAPRAAPDVRALAATALVAFGFGALATIVIKQVLAYALTDPGAGRSFVSHLALYTDVPDSSGGRPGIVRPFIRLWRSTHVLAYGSPRAGQALAGLIAIAWLIAAVRCMREWRLGDYRERAVLLVASLAPVVWVLALPQHTVIHARFMVRILVASIALAPVAALWPSSVPARRRN